MSRIQTHPRHSLDSLLVNPVRLSVLAALVNVERAEFKLVRDSVELSDSMLSKQIAQLEQAGYVEVEKGRVGRQTRTWLRATTAGETSYHRHVRALEAIAGIPGSHAPRRS